MGKRIVLMALSGAFTAALEALRDEEVTVVPTEPEPKKLEFNLKEIADECSTPTEPWDHEEYWPLRPWEERERKRRRNLHFHGHKGFRAKNFGRIHQLPKRGISQ